MILKSIPQGNGEIAAEYTDSVGVERNEFYYPEPREVLTVTNKGTANIVLSVNGTSYTITPGQKQDVVATFTSFGLESVSGTQAFIARAVNLDSNSLRGNSQIGSHRWTYNVDNGLRRWRSALARVKAGTNQIINVNVLGDSITEGLTAGGGAGAGSAGQYLTKGYVGRIRSALATKYGDVGTGFIPTYFPNGAPLWTFTGAGWSDSTIFGVCGKGKQCTVNGDSATFSFNGTGVSIVVTKGPGSGTFTASIDGGAATTFDAYSATVIAAAEFQVTGLADGAHTATITWTGPGGRNLWLLGAYPIKGTAGVRVNMVGRYGTNANQSLGTSPNYYPLYAEIDFWNPPLTIVAYTANDFTTGTPLTSYKSDLQTIITRAKQYGDCLLLSTGLRIATGTYPHVEYVKINQQLAFENDVAFIDIFNRWSGDANYANTTLGFLGDVVHPNDYGHQDIASAILSVIDEY